MAIAWLFLILGIIILFVGLGFALRFFSFMIRGVGMSIGTFFFLVFMGSLGISIGILLILHNLQAVKLI